MNIAIIHSRLNGKGGTQRQTLETAQALKRRGQNVHIYTFGSNREKGFVDLFNGLGFTALPDYQAKSQRRAIKGLGALNFFVFNARENRAARALARLIDPATDVIQACDQLAFRVAAFHKKLVRDVPSVIMMDDILTRSWKLWRRKEIDQDFNVPLRQRALYAFADWRDVRRFIKPHDSIVVMDERTRSWVKKYFSKDAQIVRSGLDAGRFPYRARGPINRDRIAILAGGVFFTHRRYEDIIRAVSLLKSSGFPDTRLTIFGDYTAPSYRPYYEALVRLADTLGVRDMVSFLGKVSEDDLLSLYHTHDIYVSANHLQSWGLAVFEAMSSGLPVIVSKSAGAAEVLTDRVNALLVEPCSSEEIARCIRELVSSPGLSGVLSEGGRAFVRDNITWDKTAHRLEKIFEEMIDLGQGNTGLM